MSDVQTIAFLGNQDHPFALTPWAIEQIEKLPGVSIGMLCLRFPSGQFSYPELIETIRLALIGGGMAPEAAKALVDSYVIGRPLTETFPLAARILFRLWNGKDPEPAPEQDDGNG